MQIRGIMAKKLSPLAKRRRKEKRMKLLKIGIPAVLGLIAGVLLIWYSCYLFGWVKYSPLQVLTGKNKPYCVVSEYKGLKYTSLSPDVTAADYKDYYDEMLKATPNYVENPDRAETFVEEGDVLNIDFLGKLDGEAFDGGSDTDYFLKIGSGKFVPGFEEALKGAVVGSTVDIDVTFPDNYYEGLAGKPVVFTVTINYVAEELNELTDEYFARNTSYSSKEEYETKYLNTYLESKKKNEAKDKMYSDILNALIENSEYFNLDEEIDAYYKTMLNYYTDMAKGYGMTLEEYVSYMQGASLSQFQTDLKNLAGITIKEQYSLRYVADEEGYKVTDEIYNAYIRLVMKDNGYTNQAGFEKDFKKSEINDMILISYTLDKLVEFGQAI